MPTELYRRMLDYWKDDPESLALNRRVWEPTPWMVHAFTGPGHPDPRDSEIRHWCWDNLGPYSAPIHDRPGVWRDGNATVHGWTWYGFATEDMMRQFLARWGEKAEAGDDDDR